MDASSIDNHLSRNGPRYVKGMALAMLVIVLMFAAYPYHGLYKACSSKSGLSNIGGNLATGGNNPMWSLGAEDSGTSANMSRSDKPAGMSDAAHIAVTRGMSGTNGKRLNFNGSSAECDGLEQDKLAMDEYISLRNVGSYDGSDLQMGDAASARIYM